VSEISIEKNLKKLCLQPGISGNEIRTGISRCVFDIIKAINNKTHIDKLGNVISVVGSGSKKIILDAHLDEVGFVVSKLDKYVQIDPVGDVRLETVDNSSAYLLLSGIPGKILFRDNILIFKPDKLDNSIKVGDLISFRRMFEVNGNEIRATALDNRIGCAVLVEVLQKIIIQESLLKMVTVVFVFSALEEKDSSNLDRIANFYNPFFGIVVDAAYAQPVDFDDTGMNIPKIGKGCAIQSQGKDFIVSSEVLKMLERIAVSNNISFQKETPSPLIGRTNFPKLHISGVRGGVINIPVAYQHREYSVANLKDIISAVVFIEAVLSHPIDKFVKK
jgi:putative aminopeptidase FrvX